jgi:hypothetical protein
MAGRGWHNGGGAARIDFFTPDSGNILDPHLRDTYTLMWNFSIQQQLARNLVLQTSYVGNHALKAYNTESLNVINPATGQRPVPSIGEIVVTQNDGRRKYQALQVSIQKRLSRGLFADAYYLNPA